ncbi:MAG: uncharacterized protein HW407_1582 [Bacteroidetes bacterium]|nr:uncharacterized protein [Bacteroidota bacterium]
MHRRNLLFVVSVIVALVTVFASAQEKKKAGEPSEEEMMKKWKEAATPGEAHKKLDDMVGSWESESQMWMAPGQPPTVSKGTSEMKWILGGRFLQQEMTGEMMGMPMNGIGLTGYDNFKKKYIGFWIDNTSTSMYTMEGALAKDGKSITFYGRTDDPVTGEKDKKVKYVTRFIDKDKHAFEIHDLSLKAPNTKVVEVTYTRKK